jgi:hypothetical protein
MEPYLPVSRAVTKLKIDNRLTTTLGNGWKSSSLVLVDISSPSFGKNERFITPKEGGKGILKLIPTVH